MNKHEDNRGFIDDLLVTDKGAVTHITFIKGAERGYHFHKETVQSDFVLSGKLLCTSGKEEHEVVEGETIVHKPGTYHGYKALEDSVLISCVYGPRKGEDYESDTYRLTA